MPNQNPKPSRVEKELNFSDKVLEKIANHAAQSIDGVLSLSGGAISDFADRFIDNPTKGVDVDTDEDNVSFELKAVLEYGKSAPQIFDRIVNTISHSVKEMTGKDVNKISLEVDDLMTMAEWKDQNKSKKDKNNDK
ncbi:Asp23/Gls24 family envelope stress response protein [Companilactobacillus nuruki]|uniref:Stress response regulator gls24 homolog n=1 Tax=Companilactobacillus nuruki TaxID=1993540 RepID=A0A2N7AXQ4_9LACO|nr:Asp23/Gls24 family envelope stress response protein [Companilactobacillus nuruki]PMD73878.1 Asp23/Gls24 family envelope stress response protein [Companilactobacillus nuruki]